MDIKEIGFGDFCTIEQKRYVGPNEFYGYKVVGRKKSNVWTDVPVDANNEKETLHDHLDDVVTVVCNNLDDRTVHQFRVRDLASVKKAQAVPEGFVLLEKKGLRDTYYWDGCEYVVDHPSEYEMELERGEIVTLEKWQRTKETNVYCANIFSDEDNFELVQFDSLEEAEKAVAANKTMIEAQEQSHD